MFGFLKKKIGEFVSAVAGKSENATDKTAEEKQQPETPKAAEETQTKTSVITPEISEETPKIPERTTEELISEEPAKHVQEKPKAEEKEGKKEEKTLAKKIIPEEEPAKIIEREIRKQETKERKERGNETKENTAERNLEALETAGMQKETEKEGTEDETEIAPDEKFEEEIEEIVGSTLEGQIRKKEENAKRSIFEEKKKEEIAKHVFKEEKEKFLSEGKQRELKPKVGIFSQLKGFLSGGEIEIGEKETNELFQQFEMALLESDVTYDTAQALITDLRKRLVGRKVQRGKIEESVKKEIAFSLANLMQVKLNVIEKIRDAKNENKTPFVILFVGPNGMGKTTTIAKVAHLLKRNGIETVISASDTFRAAAIEQISHHGEKIGVKVIKHTYGADPAAVAFDAIAYAKSHNADVVLVDTAGRQETNLNLLTEMQKLVRVTKPAMKIFIAEAIAGTALISQIKTFNEKLGLDGIILTKLDCDAKGGGSLSIAYECKLPILFVGIGQEYEDFREFNEEWIVRNVMSE